MHLQLKNVGQINDANVQFGDLTVFVGPQATGKSVALQFLKLVVDVGYVQKEMTRYGLDWSGRLPDFFDAYFGEGMRALWRDDASELWWQGNKIDLPQSRRGWKANALKALRQAASSGTSPGDPFADFRE